ncbi:glycoside hydrolase domain-containing protein [Bifidobacterium jacchi]|uniref:DUF4091 domain-containing protein n=1 Tax=Bifidobacterium jacchi TaxID=2490545 RepID=A0A5N5RM28_9BIFI|nr:glycoside hydrolase domain-containing protein [Bifidobacterium jacchi]KAB5608173.1 DUF4091 domain-containing protein [Bifidobacterium jacchi]
MYTATANRQDLYNADGVHFTDRGYQFVAEQIGKAITGADVRATTISHKKTSGDSNRFTFASGAWETGNANHTWSKTPSASLPASSIWYEVDFVGTGIDVFAGKNRPMGKVKYLIDGKDMGDYSLYNPSNIDSTWIASFHGLTEGEHTLKAVATGTKDDAASNSGIDCAKVIVYHAPYKGTVTAETDALRLQAGDKAALAVSATPDYASLEDMTYTSANTGVATVSHDGTVTAVAAGTTTITIASTTQNFSKTVNVTVTTEAITLRGGIVEPDTQYTQDRLAEVKALTATNKSLVAWRNDKVNSELALAASGTKLTNLKVTAGELKTADGKNSIAASNVTATFIKSTKAYSGNYLGYGDPTRAVPPATADNRKESNDILYQTTPITVEADKVQNVWVSFSVPKNTPAGTYHGTLTATADGVTTPLVFNYSIEVLAADLPDASQYEKNFDIELWQYPYTSAEYYNVTPFSKEHLDILKSNMELYKSVGGHAITTTISEDAWNGQTYSKNAVHYPSMVKWTKKGDGFTYDFTDFDKWVQFNKDLGIGDKIVIYSIAPWHNSFTYYDESGKLVKEAYKVGSDRWKSVWTDFISQLVGHLMDKGWFDESYIGIDERGFSKDAFDLIDSIKNIHGESLKTAGAMDHFKDKHDLAMRVTDLNVGDTAAAADPATFSKLVADRAEKGYRTTLYSCTEHEPGNFSLSAPVESYWSVINAGHETAGFLRWAYDAWVADPLNDATHNAFEPGDPFLIYPAEKNAAGADRVSKSSVRLERMGEGVRDVNKIKLMLAEIPSLQADVDAMYAKIATTPKIQRAYLTADQVTQLSGEMRSFRNDLTALTRKYLELKANGTNKVESVTITGEATMTLGSTQQLTATLAPSNLLNTAVSWSSSRTTVATVSTTGVVSALRAGSTTITATSKADPTKKATFAIKVAPATVAQGVHYYSFDDSNANDSWGTRNGTADAAASYADGKSGKALKVTDGKGVTFTGASGLKTDWSVGYWVRADKIADRVSVTMDSEKKYSGDLKMAADRQSGFHVGTNAGDVLTFRYDFKPDTWYYITWTQQKSTGLTMYVNGVKVDANAWTKNKDIPAPADVIGGTGFTGLIDEVKIYNRTLTADEVKASTLLPGLNLDPASVDVYVGESQILGVTLVDPKDGSSEDVTFTSVDPKIATVDQDGVVKGVKRGTTTITVTGGGYTAKVNVNVTRKLTIKNTLKQYQLPAKYLSDVHKSEDTSSQYFGQPDMVRTSTGRLITAFPEGHGKGPLIMKISDDEGATWTRKTDIPASWAKSQETPTMYVLKLANGTERIMLITSCPGWTDGHGDGTTGWNTSYSDDNGETWTEYKHWYTNHANGTPNKAIVGMASLVQLKDKDGNYIDKWLGVYHDYDYVNWKTYLTFDKDGNEQWSEPVKYLEQYRSIELGYQMCEIGMFRSPDGKRIIGLARSQSHNNPATLIYSDDEGETWSKPMDLPGSLAGERHKAVYDPISGRLIITFREINYDLNGNNQFDGNSDWNAGDWVMWVGTYDQLINQEDGEYRVLLAEDWANNAKSGDTGYAGIVTLADGTIIMDSYGHWDKEFSQSWKGGVTTDRCYIKQAKFKLADIENLEGLVDYSKLEKKVAEVEGAGYKQADYTADSWKALADALAEAKSALAANPRALQQVQVDAMVDAIDAAVGGLKPAGGTDPDKPGPTDPDKPGGGTDPDKPGGGTDPDNPGSGDNPNNPSNPDKKVDRTALNALIKQGAGVDASRYTAKSVAALRSALDAARAVAADANATQAQVDLAAAKLRKTIDDLVPAGNGENGQNGGTGDIGKKPGNGGDLSDTGASVSAVALLAAMMLAAAGGVAFARARRR